MKRSTHTVTTTLSVLVALMASLAQIGCQRNSQYYLAAGNKYYDQGKYADASLNYRKSIQANVKSAEAHYRLALAELRQANGVNAYDEFRRAVELAHERDEIRVQLADLCLEVFQTSKDKPKVLYDQANDAADRLLKRNPNSFDGLRLRADVLIIDGKFEDAITTFKKADAARPMDPGVVFPLVQ